MSLTLHKGDKWFLNLEKYDVTNNTLGDKWFLKLVKDDVTYSTWGDKLFQISFKASIYL